MIYITITVIHGNICDLSTKADEDPKIKMYMPVLISQTLPSPQQVTQVANRLDSASSDPL